MFGRATIRLGTGPHSSYFLFVTFLNCRACANGVTMKSFEFRNAFDITIRGKLCDRALVFNFVSEPLTAGASMKC